MSRHEFNLVVSTNAVAVRLWPPLGFVIVDTLPGAYRHRTLGDVDAHVLHKRLDAAAEDERRISWRSCTTT